ncbi:AAA family ATPase (plasmid) [Komagataeibacter intermedius]|uniref:AAA family ATPase n=1 Tax=Komagataeibacter intermedius TaxID=66229 RepID=UPI004036B0F2
MNAVEFLKKMVDDEIKYSVVTTGDIYSLSANDIYKAIEKKKEDFRKEIGRPMCGEEKKVVATIIGERASELLSSASDMDFENIFAFGKLEDIVFDTYVSKILIKEIEGDIVHVKLDSETSKRFNPENKKHLSFDFSQLVMVVFDTMQLVWSDDDRNAVWMSSDGVLFFEKQGDMLNRVFDAILKVPLDIPCVEDAKMVLQARKDFPVDPCTNSGDSVIDADWLLLLSRAEIGFIRSIMRYHHTPDKDCDDIKSSYNRYIISDDEKNKLVNAVGKSAIILALRHSYIAKEYIREFGCERTALKFMYQQMVCMDLNDDWRELKTVCYLTEELIDFIVENIDDITTNDACEVHFTYHRLILETVRVMAYASSPNIYGHIFDECKDIPVKAFSIPLSDMVPDLVNYNTKDIESLFSISHFLIDKALEKDTEFMSEMAKKLFYDIKRHEVSKENDTSKFMTYWFKPTDIITMNDISTKITDRDLIGEIGNAVSEKPGNIPVSPDAVIIPPDDYDEINGKDDEPKEMVAFEINDDGIEEVIPPDPVKKLNRKKELETTDFKVKAGEGEVAIFETFPASILHRKKRIAEDFNNFRKPLKLRKPKNIDISKLEAKFPYAKHAIREMKKTYDTYSRYGIMVRSPNIILVGPSGTGKSTLAREFFELVGIPSMIRNMASTHDSFFLTGIHMSFGESTPSQVLEEVARTKCPNMAFILDEIDKVTRHRDYGCIQDALLGVLDKKEAQHYRDIWFNRPVDLSWLTWVMTANNPDNILPALKSRCTIIKVDAPKTEHVPVIARNVVRDIEKERGLCEGWFQLDNVDITALKNVFKGDMRSFRKYVEFIVDSKENNMFNA